MPANSAHRPRIVSIGECMVELARGDDGRFQLAFGGDTFNTSVYMARLGGDVAYLTAVGDDPYSGGILDLARREGIDVDSVPTLSGRMPGLYLIETNAGERTFWYWRDRAPARELFELGESTRIAGVITAADVVYFSGVTLSLYSTAGLERFAETVQAAKSDGALVVMDSNYRPRGWGGDVARARTVFARFWSLADMALPTFEDEEMLWGAQSIDSALDRILSFGVREAVLKCGADGAIAATPDGRRRILCNPGVAPIDTTAAGDSFNAAYVCARLADMPQDAATVAAHRLAGIVVRHRGAIVPKEATNAFVLA
jgi:2-dehydro-3-deoxygluconokinase